MKKYFLLIFILFFNFAYSSNNHNNCDFKNSYRNIVKNIFPSMVSIKALKIDLVLKEQVNHNFFLYKENNHIFSTGSGFFIDESGTIVTNYHIVENSDKILVTTNNGEEFYCDIVGYDKLTDIAVIKIKTKKKIKYIELSEKIDYDVGDEVIVAGNPYNLGMSISKGIISGTNRILQNNSDGFYNNLIQTDAAINKGNSGGALFKNNGEFLGMISVIFSPNGTNIGLGFAIPAKEIINIVEQINNFGYVQRGWIGIKSAKDIHKDELEVLGLKKDKGVIITNISKNSPAYFAGLKISDIILSYNDESINNFNELVTLIRNTSINSYANIVIYRNGELKKFTIKVKEYPEDENYLEDKKYIKNNTIKMFNSKVIQINDNIRKRLNLEKDSNGLYIIEPSEYLKNNNIKAGDIVLSINQTIINSTIDMNKLISNIKNNNLNIIIINQNDINKLLIL